MAIQSIRFFRAIYRRPQLRNVLRGIFAVSSVDEIEEVVNSCCTEKFYRVCAAAVAENFERAKRFYLAEDWLYANCRELLEGLAL